MNKVEFFKKDSGETRNQYIARCYEFKPSLGMTNNEIAEEINSELGTDFRESYLRGIAKVYNECKADILNGNNGVKVSLDTNINTIVNKTEEIKEQEKQLKEIKKEKEKIEKELDKLDAKEEKRLKVVENGDYYTISSAKRSIKVTRDKVKEIKKLYCDENGVGISQLCRTLNISRQDFMLIKYAFNIVHDDVPYLDEELEEDNIDNLVNETIERKKSKYFIKLQEQEINSMKNELAVYRSKDYLYDKVIGKLNEIEVYPAQYSVEIKPIEKVRSALLDLADFHLGLKFKNYFNSYSVDEAYERAEELIKETILTCAELGVRKLHVSNLGDMIAGIIHDSITKECEITVEEQVKVCAEILIKMLVEFCSVFDKVVYSDLLGNHGRIYQKKDAGTEKENFETFISWGLRLKLTGLEECKNLTFEESTIDDGVIVKNIEGVKIYETHGHLDKFNKMASDLGMMFGKSDEVHTAHFHHNKAEEFHSCEVFMGRSFAGIDSHSKNSRLTSKAGQRLYIYSNGEREFIKDIVF